MYFSKIYIKLSAFLLAALCSASLLVSCRSTPADTTIDGGTIPPPVVDTTETPSPDTTEDPENPSSGTISSPATEETKTPDPARPGSPEAISFGSQFRWIDLSRATFKASAIYSENTETYGPQMAFDNNESTRWTSYSKKGIGSWIQLSMPEEISFETIRIYDYVASSNPVRRMKTFTVATSTDGITFTPIQKVTLTDAQSKDKTSKYFDYSFERITTKHLRITFDEMGVENASMGIYEIRLGQTEEYLYTPGSAPAETLLDNSAAKALGNVSSLLVRSEDNEGISADLFSYTKTTDRTVYLFLPCRADLSRVTFYAMHAKGEVSGPYTVDFNSSSQTNKTVRVGNSVYQVKAMQSSLPALYINTNDQHGTMADVRASTNHSVRAYGSMILDVTDEMAAERAWKTQYVSRDTDPTSFESMWIEGRGNWTWKQSKKPYEIKTENSMNLLGIGSEKNWNLLANHLDATLMRNQVLYEITSEMGFIYTPGIQPVELYINGEYQGSYSLSAKIEIGETRVNIDEEKDFLLEFDNHIEDEEFAFTTAKGSDISLHNRGDLASLMKITQIINKIEAAIYDTSSNEFLNYIDLDSWVRFFWIHDVCRNNDYLRGSTYVYYLESEGKLYAGPIWDMDNTAGIHGNAFNQQTDGFYVTARQERWFHHLMKHPEFEAAVEAYYKTGGGRELFATIEERINAYEAYLKPSAEMNFIVNERKHWVKYDTQDTWEGDVVYLRTFFQKRLAYYDNYYGY